jgi:pimeloyl-ACP methyl ester carboxylesterase
LGRGAQATCLRESWVNQGAARARRAHTARNQDRPASLLLVHGAGSGPWIFDSWPESFPGMVVRAPDLQAGLSLHRASMGDYADSVVAAAADLPAPIALCGWSMGGLVALMAVDRLQPQHIVLIEPSPPGEVQGFEDRVEIREGTFDPEAVYGKFPPQVRARAESAYARQERKRGIPVPSVSCRCLVVYGSDFPEDRGRRIARFYRAAELAFPGLDHWRLVLETDVRRAIAAYLSSV